MSEVAFMWVALSSLLTSTRRPVDAPRVDPTASEPPPPSASPSDPPPAFVG